MLKVPKNRVLGAIEKLVLAVLRMGFVNANNLSYVALGARLD